jgi:DNA-binding Lrp family transcriptional regulator
VKNAKEIQNKILGVLTSEGNLTVAKIAQRLSLRPHLIRYHLDQLFEHRQIKRVIFVNWPALGFQVFNIFFDLPRVSAKRALEFLEERREVHWLTKNIGPRTYEVTVFATQPTGLLDIFKDLGAGVGVHLRDPIFSVESESRHWGLRFFSERYARRPVSHFVTPTEVCAPDAVDLKIATLLAFSDGVDMRGRMRSLGLPQSTLSYRLDRLRARGVISEELHVVQSFHEFVQAQLVLNLKIRSKEHEDSLLEVCYDEPYVESLITGIGCWDYKIVLRADTVKRLLEVEESLLSALGRNISRSSMYIRNRIIAGRES